MPEDYKVGYGKPPKKGQFEKGKSGNPKGRPKESRNLKTDLIEVLHGKVMVKEGGKELKLTKQQALLRRMMADALQGNHRAQTLLLNVALRYEAAGDLVPAETPLSEDDKKIIDRYVRRLRKSGKDSTGKGDK